MKDCNEGSDDRIFILLNHPFNHCCDFLFSPCSEKISEHPWYWINFFEKGNYMIYYKNCFQKCTTWIKFIFPSHLQIVILEHKSNKSFMLKIVKKPKLIFFFSSGLFYYYVHSFTNERFNSYDSFLKFKEMLSCHWHMMGSLQFISLKPSYFWKNALSQHSSVHARYVYIDNRANETLLGRLVWLHIKLLT